MIVNGPAADDMNENANTEELFRLLVYLERMTRKVGKKLFRN